MMDIEIFFILNSVNFILLIVYSFLFVVVS